MSNYDINKLKEEYFEWLYNKVYDIDNKMVTYFNLFLYLHDTEFTYIIPNDVNRAIDGADLRYRFADEINDEYAAELLDGPCSVLEMIIALAIRCEEQMMDDPLYGDRTKQWFWQMIKNLGLYSMCDDTYDEEYVAEVVYDFLNRRYTYNGKGGLFYIPDAKEDLRDIEIWHQLCAYLLKYI